jgi:hypothetical protein
MTDLIDPEEFPVTPYTVQLYFSPLRDGVRSEDDDFPPQQIASGVLIKDGSKHFLLTCKHVFDDIKFEDVVILIGAGFAVRIPEEVEFINDDKDSIDLALIRLKSDRLKALKNYYSFLPSKYIGFKHVFDEELYYMLFGFINKRTTLKSRAFFVESFAYLTGIRYYKKFEELGFSYDNNITLEYNRRKQGDFEDEKARKFGPKDLKGLSGGGVWLSVAGRKKGTYKYILVAIMIEERIERGFVIATKTSLIKDKLMR